MKSRLKLIKEEEYAKYSAVTNAQIINIAHNTITDEMGARTCISPNLVGFEDARKPEQWWTLDRLFSFSSPVIHETNGEYVSFFPGIKPGNDAGTDAKRSMIDPIATFIRDNRQYYAGVYASMGTKEDRYNQILYICDNAGNILYTDTILKQTNTDAVLGESVEEKLYYTVRQTVRFVFPPSFSREGLAYYGILDYSGSSISVRKRAYISYYSKPSSPDLAHLFDLEKAIKYEPVSISCIEAQQGGRTIPRVTICDGNGGLRTAAVPDLTKDGYIVRIFRQQYRDVQKKLSSRRMHLSETADAIRDSLASDKTAGCPYSISLSGPGGLMRSFDYPPLERVMCARVITVTADKRVFIRTDLEDYAEMLIFGGNGKFINRFIFNNTDWKKRSDLISASKDGRITEIDYESGSRGTFLEWEPQETMLWQ
jgi:hypothetical protein